MLQVTTGIFGVASTIHTVIIHLNTRFENTAFSVIFLYSVSTSIGQNLS